jgi:RhoGEF domain
MEYLSSLYNSKPSVVSLRRVSVCLIYILEGPRCLSPATKIRTSGKESYQHYNLSVGKETFTGQKALTIRLRGGSFRPGTTLPESKSSKIGLSNFLLGEGNLASLTSSPIPRRSFRAVQEDNRNSISESNEGSTEHAANNKRRRRNAIESLLKSEKEYTANLAILSGTFLKPMVAQKILAPKQVSLVFANIEQIETTHAEFVSQLELLDEYSSIQKLAIVLKNMVFIPYSRQTE